MEEVKMSGAMSAEELVGMTEEQACRYLCVSRPTIRRLRRLKVDPLPYLRVGKCFHYNQKEMELWAKRAAEREQGIDTLSNDGTAREKTKEEA